MDKAKRILAQRYRKFEQETSLMLWVLWNTEEYDPFEVNLVNNSIVNDYFDNPQVKRHLTTVNGTNNNINGLDVRTAAKNYIAHFKLVHEVKPIALS
jgi:hypothetical protein